MTIITIPPLAPCVHCGKKPAVELCYGVDDRYMFSIRHECKCFQQKHLTLFYGGHKPHEDLLRDLAGIAESACASWNHRNAGARALTDALTRAEAFIAGFEDDPAQEGIAQLLAEIRNALPHAAPEKNT